MPPRNPTDPETVRLIAEEAREDAAVLAESTDLPPAAVISELGELRLAGIDGGTTRLGSLWAEGPAALVWLRHYG